MSTSQEILDKAFQNSKQNHAEISSSKKCGCFFCRSIFATPRIKQWQNKKGEQVLPTIKGATACCPICESTTVVGDSVGVKITESFLEELAIYAMPLIEAEYEPMKIRTDAELSAELEAFAEREAADESGDPELGIEKEDTSSSSDW